jgi:hypothetical protein
MAEPLDGVVDEIDADLDEPLDDAGESLLEGDIPADLQDLHQQLTDSYRARLADLRQREGTLEQLQQRAQAFDRLTTDPQFARDVFARLGIGAANPGQTQSFQDLRSETAPPQTGDVPKHVLDAVQQAIGADEHLQFLVPALAKAAWAVSQQTVAPLHQERQQQQSQQRQDEYSRMSDQLSETAPGWEQYESDMHQRLQFLQQALSGKGSLTHPKYGSVLQLLYQWSSGTAKAAGEAGRRMQRAVRNQTTTGQGGRTQAPSTADLIQQAPTKQDKWRIAFQAGMAEATGQRR